MSKGKDTSLFKVALGILLAKGIGKLLHVLRRLAWRWRRVLTPLWFGFGVWLLAVLYRAMVPGWWPVVLVLPVLGVVLAVLGPRLGDRVRTIVMKLVPEGLDRGTDGVLDRGPERTYLAVLLVWVGTYLAVRIADGPSPVTGTLWQLGVLLLGGTWWWHRRIRVAGRADKYARRWGKITRGETNSIELRALKGSRPVQVLSVGAIAKLRIRLDPGATPAQVTRCCDALASYMPKMRPGSVFCSPDEASAQHVWFTFIPVDPWKGKIPHPLPAAASTSLRELGFRFPMGIRADAKDLVYRLQHTLLVGQSGSGKSIWLHALLVWLCACRDVVIVGIDMAGGATLGVWRRVLAMQLATDPDEARHVLERVLAVIEVRERQLGRMAEDSDDADDEFMPSPETPWIVVVIDEFPDLIASDADRETGPNRPPSIVNLLGRIAKRARKCGVRLVPAAQNGSKADVGSKEMQAQLKSVVGLGLDQHASKVLWGELTKQGWNSAGLKNGQFLIRDEDHSRPEIAKGFFVTARDRRTIVTQAVEAGRPVLEPTALAALTGTGNDSEAIVIDMVTERDEELEPVVRFLRDEHSAKAGELDGLPGMPARATIFRRLKRASIAGQVRKDADDVWHYVAPGERTTTGIPPAPEVHTRT
jgi:hypothetical protein